MEHAEALVAADLMVNRKGRAGGDTSTESVDRGIHGKRGKRPAGGQIEMGTRGMLTQQGREKRWNFDTAREA
jgi:hypothetical protein